MAAGTVTLKGPATASTGIRFGLEDVIQFQALWSGGTGAIVNLRLIVTLTADTLFATPLYDSGLRPLDSIKFGVVDTVGIWVEFFPALVGAKGLLASTAYRWTMQTENDVGAGEVSALAGALTFTTAAADVSTATWQAAQ